MLMRLMCMRLSQKYIELYLSHQTSLVRFMVHAKCQCQPFLPTMRGYTKTRIYIYGTFFDSFACENYRGRTICTQIFRMMKRGHSSSPGEFTISPAHSSTNVVHSMLIISVRHLRSERIRHFSNH